MPRITFRGDSGRPGPRIRSDETELCGRATARKGESDLRNDDGVRGENRGSGLWGTRRGGRGSSEGRNQAVKRGLLVLLVLALAAPLAASAGSHDISRAWRDSYLAPSLQRAATQTPNASVPVIVQSLDGSGRAQSALSKYGTASSKLGIVDAAAGEIVAGDLPQLAATNPGLVITPDQPVVLDAKPDPKPKSPQEPAHPGGLHLRRELARRGRRRPALAGPGRPAERPLEGPRDHALDRLRRLGHRLEPRRLRRPGARPARHDFAREQLARRRQRPRDARRGPRRRFRAGHAGAAPTAGIVSLDVMDDQGMARTSDVIAAAQWILKNHRQYNIRVANFSLHSATPTSFRWDPLDKAVEKLWFAGVVVVAAAGNQAPGRPADADGLRARERPVRDHRRRARPAQLDQSRPGRLAPWSAWGYTLDGFAKPELSAPGRRDHRPGPGRLDARAPRSRAGDRRTPRAPT